MARLALAVLGHFQVTLDDVPITRFESDKARALLIYLAIERDQPHRREHLLTMFWPDQPETQGRKNLSRTLYRLRQSIQNDSTTPPFLLIDRHTIQANPRSTLHVDVHMFREALQAVELTTAVGGSADTARRLRNLEHLQYAADLYHGPLLAQSLLVDSPDFETWALARRDELHVQALTVLEHLAMLYEQQQSFDQALVYAQRLLALDPLREASQRLLMRVLAERGDRTAALKQYAFARQLLQSELNIAPEASTTALYDQIRSETFAATSGDSADDSLLQALAVPPPPCPYPGLLPFGEADQQRFFGREQEGQTLVERLSSASLQVVVGPSGSGKSSLVFAGLLPALRAAQRTNGYQPPRDIRTMRPGAHPLAALDAVLGKPTQNGEHPALAAPLLLVVDQFEEVFTSGRAEADAFQEALLHVLDTPAYAVLLVVRADFYPDLMLSPLWERIRSQRVEIVPLDAGGLRQAIVYPARDVGVEVEPALTERLIADAAGAPGVLPLLQETLTLLWENLERHTAPDGREMLVLPLAAYEALSADGRSGVQMALARRADAALAALDADQQAIARRVLLRLIQFGEGQVDTRRQQPLAELRAHDDDPARFLATVRYLAAQRLLILSSTPIANDQPDSADARVVVDLAHEALITGWPTLQSWLEQQREAEQARRRLVAKAAEWVRLGRSTGGLLDEAELPEAERWLAGSDPADLGYDADLLDLVQASRAALDAREQERAIVARRLRLRAIWLSAALVVALCAAVLASRFGITAEEAAAEAQGLALLGAAQLAAERGEPDEALTLAIAATQVSDPAPHAQAMLSEIAYAPGTYRIFTGHRAPVNSVRFSPDGRLVASSSEDTTVRLWDVATGEEVQRLAGHTDPVWGLAFSPDGQILASGAGNWADSVDTSIRLWDVATGEEVQRLAGHTDLVGRLAFSPDGRWLLSSSNDKTVRLWDVATGEQVHQFAEHPQWVWAIAFAPDGETILTGSEDKIIRLWDTATGALLREFQGHDAAIKGLAMLPDGSGFVSASWDTTMRLWNITDEEPLQVVRGHTGPIWAMTADPDGRLVASASLDRSVRLWDMLTGAEVQHLTGHSDTVRSAAIHPDGNYVISGSEDGTLRMWDTRHGAELHRFDLEPRGIDTVSFSPDGQTMLAGSDHDDGEGWLWDAATRELLHTFADTKIYSHAFSPDGRLLAYGGGDHLVHLWDTARRQEIRKLPGHESSIADLSFSADGRLLLSGSWDSSVRLWDVATGTERQQFTISGSTDPIESIALSPDGRLVLAGTRETALVHIWDARTGALVRQLVGHTAQVESIVFSPDGRLVLTAAGDGTIRLWDTERWEEVRRFEGHTDAVRSAAFHPDGHMIVSSSADTTVRLWNVATGAEVRRLSAHTGSPGGAAFSPDGQTIISGGGDSTVRLWRMDTFDDLLAWIDENRAVTDLTCEQRARYRILPLCAEEVFSTTLSHDK